MIKVSCALAIIAITLLNIGQIVYCTETVYNNNCYGILGTQADCDENYVCVPAGNSEKKGHPGQGKCVECTCYHGTCNTDEFLEPPNHGQEDDRATSCDCYPGYDGANCCNDIDECSATPEPSDCPLSGGYCVNTVGSYDCGCCDGFFDNAGTCQDVDECTTGTHTCDTNAECDDGPLTCDANTGESTGDKFTCTCNDGYIGDGFECFENLPGGPCTEDLNHSYIYLPTVGLTCKTENFVGGPCTENLNCYGSTGSVECSASTCVCSSGYTEEDGLCLEEVTLPNDCSGANTRCTGANVVCDSGMTDNCICDNGYQESNGECVNEPLDYGDDCSNGREHLCKGSLQCIDDACACPPDYTYVATLDGCFGTVQGYPCTTTPTDTCVGTNLACTDLGDGLKCNCGDGFGLWNGTDCDIDECAAASLPADCPSNGYCINTPGSYDCGCCDGYSNDAGTCEDDDECAADTHNCDSNAQCNDDPLLLTCDANTGESNGDKFICTCNDGYVGDGTYCTENLVGGNCNTNTDCHGSSAGVECSANTCVCSSGYTEENGLCLQEVTLDDKCSGANTRCTGPNVVCDSGTTDMCICDTGYQEHDGECVNEPLDHDEDCNNGREHLCKGMLQCIDDACECPPDYTYVATSDECFGTVQGYPCTTTPTDTCVGTNLACTDLGDGLRCNCGDGYVFWNGTECVAIFADFGETCAVDGLPHCLGDLACDSSDQCKCEGQNDVHDPASHQCFSDHPGGKCDVSHGCVADAACMYGICTCDEGFTPNAVMDACDALKGGSYNDACSDVPFCSEPNTECRDDGNGQLKCLCVDGHERVGSTCEPKVGYPCGSTCADSNAECVAEGCLTVCSCKNGYTVDDANCECVAQVGFYESCDSGIENICSMENAECVGDPEMCVCQPGYVYNTDTGECDAPELGDECLTTGPACYPAANTRCNGTHCICIAGFTADGDECVEDVEDSLAIIDEICVDDADCECGLGCVNGFCKCDFGLQWVEELQSCKSNNFNTDCEDNSAFGSCFPDRILKCTGLQGEVGSKCFCATRDDIFDPSTGQCYDPES